MRDRHSADPRRWSSSRSRARDDLMRFTPIAEYQATVERRMAELRAQASAAMHNAVEQMEDLHRQGVVPDRILQELRNSIRL